MERELQKDDPRNQPESILRGVQDDEAPGVRRDRRVARERSHRPTLRPQRPAAAQPLRLRKGRDARALTPARRPPARNRLREKVGGWRGCLGNASEAIASVRARRRGAAFHRDRGR